MQKKNPSARRSGAAGVSAKSAAARAPEAPPSLSLINRLRPSLRPTVAWIPPALALLASLMALANDFACDDAPQILKNPLLKSLANLPAAFTAGGGRVAPARIARITQSYYRPLFSARLMTR